MFFFPFITVFFQPYLCLFFVVFFRIRSTFNDEIANPELNPGGKKLLWRSAAERPVVTCAQ